jgi:hypothetical protein
MELKLFLVIAVLSFGATEIVKSVINLFLPELKIGIIISAVFSFAFVVGWGTGIAHWFVPVDYLGADIPLLFKYADIVTTAFILSMGSKGLNTLLEQLGVNISDSTQKFFIESEE